MVPNIDDLAEKRAIRLRIGRMRRRVDRRLRAIGREGRQAASWRAWVRRFPGQAMLAATGIGLATSAALRPERWVRVLGLYLARRAGDQVLSSVLGEFRELWAASAPKKDKAASVPSGGADHGGT